jgi:hypothetical protein
VVSQHLLGDWCDRCGLLVPASEIQGGLCGECRDGDDDPAPPGPTDAEIDRAMRRMDHVLGPGWLESK